MGLVQRIISTVVGAVMMTTNCGISTSGGQRIFDGKYIIAADKTAQWTRQEKANGYNLRIHGWEEWENAAYIGFNLPDGFNVDGLEKAELTLYTEYIKNTGDAYLYSAEYTDFEDGYQYEGECEPKYCREELLNFKIPTQSGIFKLDITDTIRHLKADTNIAFRIDVKSQNSDNDWCIVPTKKGMSPKIELTYDNSNVKKTNVTINICNNGEIIKTYYDCVSGMTQYRLQEKQKRYIRKNNDIYYAPSDIPEYYPITAESETTVNVEFMKKTYDNLAFFEDFGSDKEALIARGITGNYTIENGRAVIRDTETINLPDFAEGEEISVEFETEGDVKIVGDNVVEEKCGITVSAQGHKITSITGNGTIDNLAVMIKNPKYGEIKNNSFTFYEDMWDSVGSVCISEDDNTTFAEIKDGAKVYKTINGLEKGTYNLYADVKRDSIGDIGYMYAKVNDKPINTTSCFGNNEWKKAVIQGIKIEDGSCEIGFCGCGKFTNVYLERSDTSDVFLVGGDITELSYIENCGGKYYDENGIQKDAVQILAENGFNFARIRIYNNPGKGRGDGEFYLPDGFQDLQSGLELAKRAKDKGMKIQLTLYYSDYWADGSRQIIPYDWQKQLEGKSETECIQILERLVYEYTKNVMSEMKKQETIPEYVSLGNEMQNGILFPFGSISENEFENTARLLNSGAKAVREVLPETEIVLHLDGKMSQYEYFFDKCEELGVDYDIIGPSYYPFWSGNTVEEAVNFYNDLIKRYDKDILVMETGYNFNPVTAAGYTGQLNNSGPYEGIYPDSPDGQRAFMEEVLAGIKSVYGGRCIGDLYWNPIMINCDGVGWAVRESNDCVDVNLISNTTLFDFDGKALPVFEAFKNNGYNNDTIGIGGRITSKSGKAAVNKEVCITVNDVKYNIRTDKTGGYFVYVKYDDRITVSADTGNEYVLDTRYEKIKTGIDFTIDG